MSTELVKFNFDALPLTGYADSTARVMVMYNGYPHQMTLYDLGMSLQSAGLVQAPQLPAATHDLNTVTDADLIMEALSRGLIIQKQPS